VLAPLLLRAERLPCVAGQVLSRGAAVHGAKSAAPLKIPAGTRSPRDRSALRIPALNEPAPPARKGREPCLDEPPPFKVPPARAAAAGLMQARDRMPYHAPPFLKGSCK